MLLAAKDQALGRRKFSALKITAAAESNVAFREKQRGSGEVVMMVVACAKISRNKKVCLREDWLALSVHESSPLCGKLMTSRMKCDGQTVWL